MSVGRICCREVDLAEGTESAQAAGSRMAARNVGTLLIVDAAGRPVGIVTDRDLALRVVGLGRDPNQVSVAEVMSPDPANVLEDSPIEQALERMRQHRVRRMPVVGRDGRLVGILSMDDVLELLIEEFRSLGGILGSSLPASSRGA
jgi:CBS domain-containing protein